jgi:hypothetical protein
MLVILGTRNPLALDLSSRMDEGSAVMDASLIPTPWEYDFSAVNNDIKMKKNRIIPDPEDTVFVVFILNLLIPKYAVYFISYNPVYLK